MDAINTIIPATKLYKLGLFLIFKYRALLPRVDSEIERIGVRLSTYKNLILSAEKVNNFKFRARFYF